MKMKLKIFQVVRELVCISHVTFRRAEMTTNFTSKYLSSRFREIFDQTEDIANNGPLIFLTIFQKLFSSSQTSVSGYVNRGVTISSTPSEFDLPKAGLCRSRRESNVRAAKLQPLTAKLTEKDKGMLWYYIS